MIMIESDDDDQTFSNYFDLLEIFVALSKVQDNLFVKTLMPYICDIGDCC